LNSPLRSIESSGLTPAALTLTSTSPSPTSGSGTSTARSPSLPYRSTTNARMTVLRASELASRPQAVQAAGSVGLGGNVVVEDVVVPRCS
jgi:hypothetical protein